MFEAVVEKIENPYEDIKTISLKISSPGLTFKAGQWVDFYIPNLPVVGFSMTSPPHIIDTQGTLDLAVKYSEDPPSKWIHRECKTGDTVRVQVGGTFFYDPESEFGEVPHDLLLIGGGIGMNPLVSIAQHYAHLIENGKLATTGPPNKMVVLYSAKKQEALVFKEIFKNLAERLPTVSCRFFATNDSNAEGLCSNISGRRLTSNDVESALSNLRKDKVVVYVCGPSPMTDQMVELLLNLGLSSDNVRFEKWW